jgi:hypothetical protein
LFDSKADIVLVNNITLDEDNMKSERQPLIHAGQWGGLAVPASPKKHYADRIYNTLSKVKYMSVPPWLTPTPAKVQERAIHTTTKKI